MDLKQFVINNVKPEDYYQELFPKWNINNRPNQSCFWHDDKNPSLAVGLNNGGAKCHACGKSLGNIVHFEAEKEDIDERLAAKKIYERHIRKCYPSNQIRKYQADFNGIHTRWVEEDCGINSETVSRFGLGVDLASRRITIPIKDQFGNFTNVRYYALPRHRTAATKVKIFNAEGFGYLELFPWQAIIHYSPDQPLFMMKAEKDTLLAIQDGLQAFCVTNGELAWKEEWDKLFSHFDIGVCLDRDTTGLKAAEKKVAILQQNSKQFVTSINLPTKEKDYADWILKDNGSADELLKIFKKLKKASMKVIPPSEIKPQLPEYYSNEYQDIANLGRASDMLNLIVKVKGIVSAKTDKTYTVPYKFNISSSSTPKRVFAIPFGRELLRLIKSTDDTIIEFVKRDLLDHKDKNWIEIEPIEYITITEVEIIPIASVETDSKYVTQKCFYFGKYIDANVPYSFDIIPTTEIRSQETVGIIVGITTISSSIDEFVFSSQTFKELEEFRSVEGKSWENLCNIATQIAHQFTPIRGRLDWHIVALLSWSCPIQFHFPNEGLQRGWMNTLALGDTETGKSKVVQGLQKLFNCGVFINAENCTYVGLVGGAVKTSSGQFMLRWGRIPLCNRQLVIVEELSGLSIGEIANMSDVRSSGVARLDKGGLSGETSAKTRLICLSNVRGRDKNLAGYSTGVKAIQDLIGHGEDIARFDFIVTLTNKEVPAHIINANLYEQETFSLLKAEKLKLLLQFIWALKPDQIEFTKEAYLKCLDVVQEMGLKYHPSCHIFQSSSGRLKLARIATAVACFQFNWTNNKILVEPDHVISARKILELLYDKESFGYKTFSEQLFYRDSIRATEHLEATFNTLFHSQERRMATLQYLVHAGQFTRDEICQVAGLPMLQADQFIGKMIASNLLRKGEANVWEITTIGRGWLNSKIKVKPDKKSTIPTKNSNSSWLLHQKKN